jgi:membrane protein implicated in regulation of membrane protease activity
VSVDWSWVLIVVGAVMVLIEAAFGGFAGFDLVLIGSTFVIGGAVGLAAHNPMVGIGVAAALCVAYIAVGRRWVRDRLRRQEGVHSNADALIGRTALVTTPLSEHAPGQVKVRDEVWRARPAAGQGPYDPGAEVVVEAVDGVTLVVRR